MMHGTIGRWLRTTSGVMAVAAMVSLTVTAQERGAAPQAGRGRGPAAPTFVSPEVSGDRRVTFRIYAPDAQSIELRSPGDIPGIGAPGAPGPKLTKGNDGVWETTVGPVPAGAYRYSFQVNGVAVVDSKNPITSQTNTTVLSLVVVPGSEVFDTRNVAHGAVAAVHYYSSALGGTRRAHVYTPPGYDSSRDRYPVLYLLHGAGDVDQSWSTVGRAGFILDNLIASGRAKPMLVVMPAGHVNGAGSAIGATGTPAAQDIVGTGQDPFVNDFLTDLLPYVEKTYRVLADRQNRAIAGLSMGGSQTLNIAIPRLDRFGYIGVFSSGVLSGRAPNAPADAPFGEAWEKQNLAALDNAATKRDLRLLWFGIGKDDFLLSTSRSSVELLKKHGFKPVSVESEGGHTWLNWRDYLATFAPQLFQTRRVSTD